MCCPIVYSTCWWAYNESAMFSKDAVIKSFNSIILIKVKYKNILISFPVLDIRKILSLQHQRQQRLQNNEK